jgi:hypothetical protein
VEQLHGRIFCVGGAKAAVVCQDVVGALGDNGIEPNLGQQLAEDVALLAVGLCEVGVEIGAVGLDADGSLAYEYKYGRQAGQFAREDTINVPLTADMLPAPTARLVREKLPLTWKSLEAAR